MMATFVKLALNQSVYSGLLKLAIAELRSPADQAHFIIRQELVRHHLLSAAQDDQAQDSALSRVGHSSEECDEPSVHS